MLDWLTNIHQQIDINNTRSTLRTVEREAISSQAALDDLRTRVDSLALASAAMWELVADRLGVERSALEKRMTEIDFRDGTPDGRITPTKTTCPGCSRTVHANRPRCLYCGTPLRAQV
jgi:hypothetical protein